MDRDELRASLRTLTGSPDATFRPGQAEAIQALVERQRRVLLVQRTGWGKSAVYFLATHLLRRQGLGPTLLISPLLSLMRNQVDAARRLGIRAHTINSTNPEEHDRLQQLLEEDAVDLLLVSPERLSNRRFREEWLPLIARRPSMLVIDEVHCISDWGHDFRPDYRRLRGALNLLPPGTPVLGCTATANDRVVADIQEQLGDRLLTIRGPLGRDGLSLQVIDLPAQAERLAWLAHYLPHLPGSGIVYCLTVSDARFVADFLTSQGLAVRSYTASHQHEERLEAEDALLQNRVKALVATTALGMGYDKPDLGFVIHYQGPGSAVAYYQQVGRAGRSLGSSQGVLLSGTEDSDIQDWFIERAFPEPEIADAVLDLLEDADDPLSVPTIERSVNVRRTRLELLLKQLEVERAVEDTGSGWVRTFSPWAYPEERVRAVTAARRAEQQQMREYAAGAVCRMRFLSQALDDSDPSDCGICDVCSPPRFREPPGKRIVEAASIFLGRQHIVIEPRRMWPAGGGGRIPEDEMLAVGRALCRWGSEPWGPLVRHGKQNIGRFDEALVDALAVLVREWQPSPAPRWITSVPSLRNVELVPDLARRLAECLHLPYHAAVEKVRRTEPQKSMQNSAQQVRNLAGAFAVSEIVHSGPVLLVDDIVDSKWTMTVVGQQLRRAGVPLVYPVTLATAEGTGS